MSPDRSPRDARPSASTIAVARQEAAGLRAPTRDARLGVLAVCVGLFLGSALVASCALVPSVAVDSAPGSPFIQSLVALGAVAVGALIGGVVADRRSRRMVLIVVAILGCVALAVQYLNVVDYAALAARAALAATVGATAAVVLVVLAERTPAEHRGVRMIGVPVVALVAWAVSAVLAIAFVDTWSGRAGLVLPMLLAAVWLVALVAIPLRTLGAGVRHPMRAVVRSETRRPLSVVLVVALAQVVGGVGVVATRATHLYTNAGVTEPRAPYWTVGVSTAVALVGMLLARHFIDTRGRRVLLRVGINLNAASLVAIALLSFARSDARGDAADLVMVCGLWFAMLGWGMSLGSVAWVAIAELAPPPARSSALGLACAAVALGSAAFATATRAGFDWVGDGATFAVTGVLVALAGWWALARLPETQGRPLDAVVLAAQRTASAGAVDSDASAPVDAPSAN